MVSPKPISKGQGECESACNKGSDSISMKFSDGLRLSSERNQCHANQISGFVSHSHRPDRRQRRAGRGRDYRDGPCRGPDGDVPFVLLAVAARSQPIYPAGLGPPLLRAGCLPSRRGTTLLLRPRNAGDRFSPNALTKPCSPSVRAGRGGSIAWFIILAWRWAAGRRQTSPGA